MKVKVIGLEDGKISLSSKKLKPDPWSIIPEKYKVGDVIEVPVDTTLLYGERDESLVFTDRIENVPEEYHEIGMTITMENEKGEPRNFIVTRFDDKTLTVDGNNPLCGRDVTFVLEVLSIREATDEEIELGGAVDANPDLNEILARAK